MAHAMTGHVCIVIHEPATGRWLVDCQEYRCRFRSWDVNEGGAVDQAITHEDKTTPAPCYCWHDDGRGKQEFDDRTCPVHAGSAA